MAARKVVFVRNQTAFRTKRQRREAGRLDTTRRGRQYGGMTTSAQSQPAPQPWVKNYQPGVAAEIKLPNESLVGMFERSVAEAAGHPAMEFFAKRTSYRELGEQVAQAAEGLRRLGVKAGDRVAVILPNCPQHVVAFYAVLRLGAVVVEHNPLYTSGELLHQFQDHGARVAIAWDKSVASLLEFPADERVERIVAVNLLEAFPTVKRLALGLPLRKLRATRDALTGPAPGTMPWKPTRRLTPAPRHARPCRHWLHLGHHGPPQGGHADPLQSVFQRTPRRGLDARGAGAERDPVCHPAHVPCLWHDALPHRRPSIAPCRPSTNALPWLRRKRESRCAPANTASRAP